MMKMNRLKKIWFWLEMSKLGDLIWFVFHIPSIIINSDFVQRNLSSSWSDSVSNGSNYHTMREGVVMGKIIFGSMCLAIGLIVGLIFKD